MYINKNSICKHISCLKLKELFLFQITKYDLLSDKSMHSLKTEKVKTVVEIYLLFQMCNKKRLKKITDLLFLFTKLQLSVNITMRCCERSLSLEHEFRCILKLIIQYSNKKK